MNWDFVFLNGPEYAGRKPLYDKGVKSGKCVCCVEIAREQTGKDHESKNVPFKSFW